MKNDRRGLKLDFQQSRLSVLLSLGQMTRPKAESYIYIKQNNQEMNDENWRLVNQTFL